MKKEKIPRIEFNQKEEIPRIEFNQRVVILFLEKLELLTKEERAKILKTIKFINKIIR